MTRRSMTGPIPHEPDKLAVDMIGDLQNALELPTEVSQVVTKRPS